MENFFKFKKADLEIEFLGEREFVENQINSWKNFLQSADSQTNSNEDFIQSENKTFSVKKNINVNDFLKLKEPKTDEDKVICVSYYLEKYEYYESFTELDIFKLLNIDNIENLLQINLEKGFLINCKEKNNMPLYSLTYSGEIYVREGLVND